MTRDDLPPDPGPDQPPADFSRQPPHDLAAERAVLGAMMLTPAAIDQVTPILSAADFYRGAHATMWQIAVDLHSHGDPVDPVTMMAALTAAGEITRVGGPAYLHDCVSSVPTIANAAYYARQILDLADRRRFITAAAAISQMSWSRTESVSDMRDLAQQRLLDLTTGRSGDWVLIGDAIPETVDAIEATGRGTTQAAVPTRWRDLDKLLGGGLHPGQMITVAGRPGLGKSVTAIDMLRACSTGRGRRPSMMFSLEMSVHEIVLRMLSAAGQVSLSGLREGALSDEDWVRIARAAGEDYLGDAPIYIDPSATISLAEIRAKARRVHDLERARGGLALIVVDYLQLMSGSGAGDRRQQEVAEFSRGLKLLAKDLGAAVVAVSQLNRSPEQRADKRPQLSDLRESGAIEQDSDVVILVHRDDYYEKESPRAGEADFIVAKQRNGPTDTVTVAFQGHYSRFVDMSVGVEP